MKWMFLIAVIGLLFLSGCGPMRWNEVTNEKTDGLICYLYGFDEWRYSDSNLFNRDVDCKSLSGKIVYSIEDLIKESPVNQLGQAICDQQYKMDFDYYLDKTLHCITRQKSETKKYDGIEIQMGG